jgi:alpha-beta hydrolase superfamily lysophospholipase
MTVENSQCRDISFYADSLLLHGTLHLPAGGGHPAVVIGCHGLYSNQDSPKQIALARACNARGLAFFRFDHRGCGRSQGEFERVTSLAARSIDLKAAIAAITNRLPTCPRLGLFGSSMGGTVCLSVAGALRVDSIVTFAAPLCSDIDRGQLRAASDPKSPGIFLDADKSDFDISGSLSQVRNLLIFHGEKDQTVPLSHAREIYRLAGDPKKMIVQPNGDHRMSNAIHQEQFIQAASRWLAAGLITPPSK